MKTIIFGFLSLFSLGLTAQNMIHKEVLGRPTFNSITIQTFYDQEVEVSVAYGLQSNNLDKSTIWQKFAANEPAEVVLSQLTEGTKYYYRVSYRKPLTNQVITRPIYQFQTAKKKGVPYTFVVQADPHLDEMSDTALYSICLRNQLEDNPDFMIDLGDFLMSDKLRNASKVVPKDTITYRSKLLRSFYEKVNHSVPLFIALGNHEGEAGWLLNGTANTIPVWGTNDRKKYFTNPIPNEFYTGDTINHPFVGVRENYYSFHWGDALFIVLDPYWYTTQKPDAANGWKWTLGKGQYDWLKKTLEMSDAPFKFVFSHQLIGGAPEGRGGVEFADLYEWGGNNQDGTYGFTTNRPGWDKPIKELLKEHKVSIFFHGHDHFYGKQEKDCLIYQECPQPSLPNFQNANMATDYGYKEGVILPNAGHLRIQVNPEQVKVEYVRAYLPKSETSTRKNKDISATYFVQKTNCYDTMTTSTSVIWNEEYSDEKIYPNPFKQDVKIHFSVTKTEHISLQILDQEGRIVKELIQESEIQPGVYQVDWDGKDQYGKSVSPGNYFYLIQGQLTGQKQGKIVYID